MSYSLILQYPYEMIQIALCQNGNILSSTNLHKFNATSLTIPTIIQLLDQKNLKLSDLSFLGINVGPGPYNTLRAILTMVNGIHRVNQIPLVAANALDLLSCEIDAKNSLVVLNAFENHVFYQINKDTKKIQGASSLADLKKIIDNDTCSFVIQGNSLMKYEKELKGAHNICWPEEILAFNKLETLAQKTFQDFKDKKFNHGYIKPIYFEDLATSSYKS